MSSALQVAQCDGNPRYYGETVPPGVREPLRAHRYPSVLYYISAAHMKEYSPGVPAVDRGHKDDGDVIFLPVGPPYQMENLETNKPLKAIRVELKKTP